MENRNANKYSWRKTKTHECGDVAVVVTGTHKAMNYCDTCAWFSWTGDAREIPYKTKQQKQTVRWYKTVLTSPVLLAVHQRCKRNMEREREHQCEYIMCAAIHMSKDSISTRKQLSSVAVCFDDALRVLRQVTQMGKVLDLCCNTIIAWHK